MTRTPFAGRHPVYDGTAAAVQAFDPIAAEAPPTEVGVEAPSTEIGVEAPPTEVGIEAGRRRGRGASSNRSGRYESEARVAVDDGWDSLDDLPPLATHVQIEKPKKIITRNSSPDISFDRSINPYRGCEHGCSYCFARPTHAYMGLSPGLDFETKLFVKPNAADLLARELSVAGYEPKTLAIGTNTDPYQPIERRYRIMREVLEVLERANHPVAIVTKSALVARDRDILGRMAAKGLAKVALSVTTLDRHLARAMEPRASTPDKRLAAIRDLAEAGIPAAVMVAPVIPALNDSELERILEAAHAHGAREAGYVLLRLPLEVSELFKEWLLEHCPDRYRHVLSILRSMRDGKDYDATWGKRMRGTGPYAQTIAKRFEVAARRIGLNKGGRTKLRTDLFEPPLTTGVQLKLF
ncbi:PA0069 family radical SAM protein [Methyloraptor flagellatus]|jgi:DNA repair photolyase|uniref:PA0069 family radical SAM protein n=1 Tax=Methyloraptor flagellatus TaxID=3162530 RepID=A0AAU7X4R5_9HYPH